MTKKYSEFYHLTENPFAETPDPKFFYKSQSHQMALLRIANMLESKKGLATIIGDVGTGKTLLSRVLIQLASKHTKTGLILNAHLEGVDLLRAICNEFKIKTHHNMNSARLMDKISDFLIKNAETSSPPILIVDEAHRLSANALETIRLISNIECDSSKLLHILLVGQDELEEKLKTRELRQINQRLSIRLHLYPMTKEETFSYIHHRLDLAGASNFLRFDKPTCQYIHQLTKGNPRLINMICQELVEAMQEKGKRRLTLSDTKKVLITLGWIERNKWSFKETLVSL